jgi:hypothetical protein
LDVVDRKVYGSGNGNGRYIKDNWMKFLGAHNGRELPVKYLFNNTGNKLLNSKR